MAAQKLSRSAQNRIKRVHVVAENIGNLARSLNPEAISELIRRDQIPYDGRAGRGDATASGRRSPGTFSDPTMDAVIARMDGSAPHDIVAEKTREVEKALLEIESGFQKIFRLIDFLNSPAEKKRTQRASEPCVICHVLPQNRQEMCVDCEIDYVSAGSPDRQRWVSYMNQTRNFEGVVLIPDQPAPRRALVMAASS